MRFILQAEL